MQPFINAEIIVKLQFYVSDEAINNVLLKLLRNTACGKLITTIVNVLVSV